MKNTHGGVLLLVTSQGSASSLQKKLQIIDSRNVYERYERFKIKDRFLPIIKVAPRWNFYATLSYVIIIHIASEYIDQI